MKFVEPSQFADPDVAARKLVEIANGIEAVQEGRIYIGRSTARSSKLAARQTSTAPLWPRDLQGLAVAVRVRDLCKIHACRCRHDRPDGLSADGLR